MRKILLCLLAFFLFNTAASHGFYAVAASEKPPATAQDVISLRSKLLLEGFGLPDEFESDFVREAFLVTYQNAGRGPDPMRSTLRLANVLESFKIFPAVYAKLHSDLFDRSVPIEARQKRFCGQAYILGSVAGIIYSESKSNHYWSVNIGDITGKWEQDASYQAERLRAHLPAKKALATEYMLTLLKLMEEAQPADGPGPLDGQNMKNAAWYFDLDSAKDRRAPQEDWPFLRAAERAALVLSQNHLDAGFVKKARAILALRPSSALDRLDALESLLASPESTPAQAVQRAPFRNELKFLYGQRNNALNGSAWFTPAAEEYAGLGRALLASMQSSGRLPVACLQEAGPGTGETDGEGETGIEISAIGKVPAVFMADTPMYLLFSRARDSRGGAYGVNKRLVEEGRPVFGASVLSALDGPVLLPLNPAKQADAKLLSWYATTGSAEGGALLISSPEPEERLLARLLAWHLLLGKTGEADRLLLVNPAHGDFLLNLLPCLRGDAARIFLLAGECFWFDVPGPAGSAWYRATGLTAPGKSGETPGTAMAATSSLLPAGRTFLELDAALTEKLLRLEEERRKEKP